MLGRDDAGRAEEESEDAMTGPRRYHAIALHGGSNPEAGGYTSPDSRAHGVQVGGCGGRIIGHGWNLDRVAAERIAAELERAHKEGRDG